MSGCAGHSLLKYNNIESLGWCNLTKEDPYRTCIRIMMIIIRYINIRDYSPMSRDLGTWEPGQVSHRAHLQTSAQQPVPRCSSQP